MKLSKLMLYASFLVIYLILPKQAFAEWNVEDYYATPQNSNFVPSPIQCPAGSTPSKQAGDVWVCHSNENAANTGDMNMGNPFNSPPKAAGGTSNDYGDDDEDPVASPQCKSAYDSALRSCKNVEYSGVGSQLLTQFAALKSGGNIKEACAAAKKISVLSMGANTTFGVMCQRSSKSCLTECDPKTKAPYNNRPLVRLYETYYSECKAVGGNAVAGYMQAGNDVVQFLASKACEDAADAKCIGQNSVNDPDCAQFCSVAGRETHPKCLLASSSCANGTFYAQNTQFCQCISNPSGVGCNNSTFSGTTGNSALNNLKPGDLGLSDANDFLGNESGGSGSGVESGSGGGSGFSGGGSGSYALPSDGRSGSGGEEALNKDILTGSGGGSGGGAMGGFFGYGGSEGSGGGGKTGGGSNAEGSGGIDLKAFLPGGKQDPRRAPASDSFESAGITKSDGLTNFQKVTRKINQKLTQGELKP